MIVKDIMSGRMHGDYVYPSFWCIAKSIAFLEIGFMIYILILYNFVKDKNQF